MIKKRKIGIILILIGIALPLVLFFFQEEGEINLGSHIIKEIDRKLTPEEVEKIEEEMEMTKERLEEYLGEDVYLLRWSLKLLAGEELKKEKWTIRTKAMLIIPYKYTVGIGIIIIFIGIGKVIFSFYPKETKSKK